MTPPEMNPANLILRFALELCALVTAGYWGWARTESWPRWLLAAAIPLALAAAWGVFNVAEDPSRSGAAPVQVPGTVRLWLELLILGFGGYALSAVWRPSAGLAFVAIVLVHYALSWQRLAWLLRS